MRQWWTARWATRSGLDYEYMFEGPVSEEGARGRMIANLCTMGVHRPDMYRLERVSPRLEGMKWNYPMLVASNKPLTR